MENKNYLEKAYKDYFSGNIEKRDLEKLIYEFGLENYSWEENKNRSKSRWYPYMPKIIKEYQKSIEKYIIKKENVPIKKHKSKETNQPIKEYDFGQINSRGNMAVSDEPSKHSLDYLSKANPKKTKNKLFTNRQILILLLKCYSYIDEDLISDVASFINMNKDELTRMVDKIKEMRASHDKRIKDRQRSIYDLLFRCMMWEQKLQTFLKESGKMYEEAKGKLERARNRYEINNKRFLDMKRSATNAQVAFVMGIAKGIVDTDLSIIKHKIEAITEDSMKMRSKPINLLLEMQIERDHENQFSSTRHFFITIFRVK